MLMAESCMSLANRKLQKMQDKKERLTPVVAGHSYQPRVTSACTWSESQDLTFFSSTSMSAIFSHFFLE
ncbi:UNVERIFIED_CONTAM: hypothetical protein FKN15_058829 [Acipenser sinensis]